MYHKNLYGKKLIAVFMGLVFALTACAAPTDNAGATAATTTLKPTETDAAQTKTTAQPQTTTQPEKEKEITSTYGILTELGTMAHAESYSDRALVAVKEDTRSPQGILVSWRAYESDSEDIRFTLERNGEVIYTGDRTCYMDSEGKSGDVYRLTVSEGLASVDGKTAGQVAADEQNAGEETIAWAAEYQEFTLQAPKEQTMPDGTVTDYTSNDMSVGDLDGDGQLELIVKWYPDNAQDNSNDGYTGTTILDAYDIDIATGNAELMWRIDLGLNIRSGAHYTQFQVWDYDGDGYAEVMCKTADGTTTYDASLSETGYVGAVSMSSLVISAKGTPEGYDFRQHTGRLGRIVLGQEYLTVFDGKTGMIIDTVEYIPERGSYDEAKGIYDTTNWGLKNGKPAEKNDGYANRCDRFLAATAYLDDGAASAIFCRGYYGRTAITAWKLIDKKLVMQWAFDVPNESEYAAQGNHGLSVNDVDNDGYDEIVYGALVVDNTGEALYATGLGHGDAMHVSDWNNDGKLEVFSVHEEKGAQYQTELRDAETGEILWGYFCGKDTGRGMAADIDPRYEGAEMWSAAEKVTYDSQGNVIYNARPSQNFSLYWDGDLLMELFDYKDKEGFVPQVQKWDYENQKKQVLLEADGAKLNNDTKANAGLVADIYGDWREEIIVRDATDKNKIRIYSTTIATEYVFSCLLEDRTYREGVAWQNTAYNQPANLPYLLSEEISR